MGIMVYSLWLGLKDELSEFRARSFGASVFLLGFRELGACECISTAAEGVLTW